jgi:hypothetical protein
MRVELLKLSPFGGVGGGGSFLPTVFHQVSFDELVQVAI